MKKFVASAAGVLLLAVTVAPVLAHAVANISTSIVATRAINI